MVRNLTQKDLFKLAKYSKDLVKYAPGIIDYSKSFIKINETDNSVEWFFVISQNHETPQALKNLDTYLSTLEIVDIYCSSEDYLNELLECFQEVITKPHSVLFWKQRNDNSNRLDKFFHSIYQEELTGTEYYMITSWETRYFHL